MSRLVEIDYLNVVCVSLLPYEAYPPLAVDSNAVLTHAVTLQLFQLIPRRLQVHQFSGSIQHPQLASGGLLENLEAFATVTVVQFLGFPAAERLNHNTLESILVSM
jgi:hypothetical protein